MPSAPNMLSKRLLIPILAAFSIFYTPLCIAQTSGGEIKLRTVVIDAGHGGHDPGAVSKNSTLKEKDINLDVALSLGKKIEASYPDVKVIYTRKTDVFKELSQRSDIANKNHADLFISIHVNSEKGSTANGTETFVMGTDKSESNMAVCRRENSVILLENDYSTTYQGFEPDNPESYIIFNLMQSAHFEHSIAMASLIQQNFRKNGPITKSRGIKQAPLMVLWRTTMPSVLVEIGFISNASDRQVLNVKANRDKIASDLFDAFASFKKMYDNHVQFVADESVFEADDDEPSRYYSIQVLTSAKKLSPSDPQLKGLVDVNCRLINGVYKYSVGNFKKREDAVSSLPQIKKLFPDAFVVFVE